MTPEFVLYLGRRTMETALILAGPVLGVTLVLGFLVAMIQAVTSIKDMTMGMVLKLVGIGVTVLLLGGWMMHVTKAFAVEVFNHMRTLGG